jgi:hypothetical protein
VLHWKRLRRRAALAARDGVLGWPEGVTRPHLPPHLQPAGRPLEGGGVASGGLRDMIPTIARTGGRQLLQVAEFDPSALLASPGALGARMAIHAAMYTGDNTLLTNGDLLEGPGRIRGAELRVHAVRTADPTGQGYGTGP